MKITYKTNGVATSTSLTEWYFGRRFVAAAIRSAKAEYDKAGKCSMKFWQNGTGYLTVEIH